MDDLISRRKVIDTIEKIKKIAENELHSGEVLRTFNVMLNSLINIISLLPQAQPEPKRGKWIEAESQCGIKCSKCGYPVDDFCHSIDYIDLDYAPNYCPNCGRDMREE